MIVKRCPRVIIKRGGERGAPWPPEKMMEEKKAYYLSKPLQLPNDGNL